MIVDQKLNKNIIGAYLIDGDINGTMLGTTKKPNLFNRLFIRLILGWKWISINKIKK